MRTERWNRGCDTVLTIAHYSLFDVIESFTLWLSETFLSVGSTAKPRHLRLALSAPGHTPESHRLRSKHTNTHTFGGRLSLSGIAIPRGLCSHDFRSGTSPSSISVLPIETGLATYLAFTRTHVDRCGGFQDCDSFIRPTRSGSEVLPGGTSYGFDDEKSICRTSERIQIRTSYAFAEIGDEHYSLETSSAIIQHTVRRIRDGFKNGQFLTAGNMDAAAKSWLADLVRKADDEIDRILRGDAEALAP
jgi:hypothetical protein